MNLRAFQCFAAGTHSDMHGRTVTFSRADISTIAAGYSPNPKAAPLVLGHPEDDTRALSYGSVRALVAEGDALFAIADVSSELQQLVRAGRYKNVSASLRLPGTKENPGFGYSLRHVGFLGAVPPAVKGMQPLAFALADEFGSLDYSAPAPCTEEQQARAMAQVAIELRQSCPSLSLTRAVEFAQRAYRY